MRKYETIFIINPDLSEEDTQGVVEKVKELIQSLQGEVLKTDGWGIKKLAYDVKKKSKGYFVLLHFMGTAQILTEVERNLRLMDTVLKHQTVRLDEKAERAAQMLSGEKISEKEEQPETKPEKKAEKGADEVEKPQQRAHERPPEETKATEEPESGGEEGTVT